MCLVSIGSKDIVFATVKVCVYLAWQKRVFGYVCTARVLVKRQEEEDCEAGNEAEKRSWGSDLEEALFVPAESAEGRCCGLISRFCEAAKGC
jgi:hypothetical protein